MFGGAYGAADRVGDRKNGSNMSFIEGLLVGRGPVAQSV